MSPTDTETDLLRNTRDTVHELEFQRYILKLVADNTTSALFLMDRSGCPTFMNAAAESMTGFTLDEIRDRPLHNSLHHHRPDGSEFPIEECAIDRALPDRSEVHGHSDVFIRKDGSFFPVVVSASPIVEEGNSVGTVIEVRDVTLERTTQERVRLLTELIPVQVWTATPDGKLDYVSGQVTSYFGLPSELLLGDGWADQVHPDDRPHAAARWAHSLQTGDPYEAEFRLRRADGSYRWHLARAAPKRDVRGKIIRWFGSNTDFDDRRSAEIARDHALAEAEAARHGLQREVAEQVRARREVESKASELAALAVALERSNKELDQFAYIASHDLKAPLRGIANLAQWIEEDVVDGLSDQSREHMRLLQGRVHRMEALIDGILEYSRAGRVRSMPENVDTAKLLDDIIDLLPIPTSLAVRVQDDMPVLKTERIPLQQVFLNLLGNAVKFTAAHRESGLVEVAAERNGECWEFSVKDNGPGIPAEYQERIWTIFQTLAARDKVEGTGIGLSVVRKIVESRGGRAWVESQPGTGTTFRFTWPARLNTET